MTNRLLLALVLCWSSFAAAAPPRVSAAPAPSAASPMWLDPALPGTPGAAELLSHGYERLEYFQSGTANVYGYDETGKARIEQGGVPYTTRVIVIRPKDGKRFSGTVHLNPFHPVNGTGIWANVARHVMDKGDAFVGVMTGADDNTRNAPPGPVPIMAPKVLGWFNPQRYAPIVWPADEDGIRWDVFAQTAQAVRSGNLLGGLKPAYLIASGWSFTGSFLRTFINEGFHDRHRQANGKPLIDGYLIGISSFSFRSGYVPINSRSRNLPEDDPRRANRPIDVPVIELQSENEAITNREPQTPDRDGPPGAHRLYEVPGLTHGSGRGGSNLAQIQIAARTGQPAAPPRADSCPFPRTDMDMSDYGTAALANLDRWIRTGTPPPRAARLQQAGGKAAKDADGNSIGGVRPAQIAVPLAAYGEPPAGAGCAPRAGSGLGSASIEMRRMPFSAQRLAALYPGGKGDYLRRFDAAVDALVAERWLRPADASRQKAEAREAAEKAFP